MRLLNDICSLLLSAKSFIFIEHQYPFQNGAITYYMCEALRRNPELKLLIVTAVKTDLPTGILGDLFDWSQDHIIDHLHLIHQVAPDRVGVYGLVVQNQAGKLRPIYVHSKLIVVDDLFIITGSSNMDNNSFF